MYKNVENVDSDTVTIRREDYEQLVHERDEYRSIAHAFNDKFDSLLSKFSNDNDGGVTSE